MTSKRNKIFIIVIIPFIVWAAVLFYFTTGEKYYITDFQENTQLKWPNSGKSVYREESSSFGDYSICYVYNFPITEIENLHSELLKTGFVKSKKNYLETDESDKFFEENQTYKPENILVKDSGFKMYEVIFLNDGKTVMFNSNKW